MVNTGWANLVVFLGFGGASTFSGVKTFLRRGRKFLSISTRSAKETGKKQVLAISKIEYGLDATGVEIYCFLGTWTS
jgi:hypothetical protein